MTTAAPLRRVAAGLVVPLLAAVLVSAGGSAAPASAQQASPSPTASGPAPIRVTNADSGRTVRLVPGQHLDVELTAPQGEQWQGPASAGPLYLVDYRETAERTTARLQALRADSEGVVLRARTDRECFHNGQPCPQAFQEWSLQVVVDPGQAVQPSYPCHAMAMPSPAPGHVVVTEHDNGRRFSVEVGKSVQVYLGDCSDPYAVPSAGGPLFRQSASYAANGLNATTFRALSTGTTSITSSSDPACFHTAPPCARPAVVFSVEIEVVPQMADDRCLRPTGLSLDRGTIIATGTARATVQSAPGVVVDLFAYTRPSTAFRLARTGTTDAQGVIHFDLRPPANTRLYAVRRDCSSTPTPHAVLNVATALTLEVTRTGPRTYRFSGDSLPARPGGLVVSLYRVGADGREVLTAQARADEASGEWQLVRRFTGTGRFGFVARTGADLQNAPGRSALRTVLVH